MEEWKIIEEAPGYEVSNFGNIRNKKTLKILKGRTSLAGYLQVSITIVSLGKQQNRYIHRLVSQYFIPNPDNKLQVNHKDGNKLNNHFENLEWVTPSENQLHKQRVLGKTKTSQRKIGKYSREEELLESYDSILAAAASFNRNRVNIDSVLQGKQKTAYGFIWKYLD